MTAKEDTFSLVDIKSPKHGAKKFKHNVLAFRHAIDEWKKINQESSQSKNEDNELNQLTEQVRQKLDRYASLLSTLCDNFEQKFVYKKTHAKDFNEIKKNQAEATELSGNLFAELSMQANRKSAKLAEGEEWDTHQRIKHHLTGGLKSVQDDIDKLVEYYDKPIQLARI